MSSGEKIKLAIVHIGFFVFYVAYCAYVIVQWRYVSHSIDLVAYLDIGDAYWRGDFHNAINHTWSPLYSWILGGVMALFKPDIANEMLAVRLTNFALMLGLYGAFVLYAKTLRRGLFDNAQSAIASSGPISWPSKTLYWSYMYSILCFSALCFGGCEKDGPDIVTAALALLASTAFLKIKFGDRSRTNMVFMGVVLAFGYFAKAIMLPLSLFYYLAAWWEMRKEKIAWSNIATAFGVEAILALPFVALLSITFGYFTFSDASRVITLWSEKQDNQQVHFQFPELKHRSNKIFTNPDVFEFAEPIHATYSPWNNNAYWTEGAPNKDPIGRALRHFTSNISYYLIEMFSYMLGSALLASFVMRRPCFTLAGIGRSLTLCAPALVAMAAYSVSAHLTGHMMERYFIAWTILLYSAVLIALRTTIGPTEQHMLISPAASPTPLETDATVTESTQRELRGKRVLLVCIAVSMMLNTIILLGLHAHVPVGFPGDRPYDVDVAQKARELGLKPGDKIAQIGFRRYYWARLAKLRIVADIFDVNGFWAMEPERRQQLIDTLRSHGVRAIIQTWAVDENLPEPGDGWVKVPDTRARIYLIPEKASEVKGH